jgi:hypothetical protein
MGTTRSVNGSRGKETERASDSMIVGLSNMRRTTIVLPRALDANLEIFAGQLGVPKVEVIKQALSEFLKHNGFEPDRTPKRVHVTY